MSVNHFNCRRRMMTLTTETFFAGTPRRKSFAAAASAAGSGWSSSWRSSPPGWRSTGASCSGCSTRPWTTTLPSCNNKLRSLGAILAWVTDPWEWRLTLTRLWSGSLTEVRATGTISRTNWISFCRSELHCLTTTIFFEILIFRTVEFNLSNGQRQFDIAADFEYIKDTFENLHIIRLNTFLNKRT